jgi:hypothetical protein
VATPASNGDRTAAARSAVVVDIPPLLTDGHEWFVPEAGRGGRRGVRVGEHLAADHPLVLAYPEHFAASLEPVDTWPVGTADTDTRKRQQAERLRLAAHPARRIIPCCARCGAEAEESVVLFDQPTQLGLLSELSGLDDGDPASWVERQAIEDRYLTMARAAQEQEAELARVEAAWRAEHQQCPEGTALLPEPEVPERPPLFYRLPGVRTLLR